MLSAKEARDIVLDSINTDIEKEWFLLESTIENTVKEKKFFTTIYKLCNVNYKRLVDLGYEISCTLCNNGKAYWTISWGKLIREGK